MHNLQLQSLLCTDTKTEKTEHFLIVSEVLVRQWTLCFGVRRFSPEVLVKLIRTVGTVKGITSRKKIKLVMFLENLA